MQSLERYEDLLVQLQVHSPSSDRHWGSQAIFLVVPCRPRWQILDVRRGKPPKSQQVTLHQFSPGSSFKLQGALLYIDLLTPSEGDWWLKHVAIGVARRKTPPLRTSRCDRIQRKVLYARECRITRMCLFIRPYRLLYPWQLTGRRWSGAISCFVNSSEAPAMASIGFHPIPT